MITTRGFTFNGHHSSEFNVYMKPDSRVLIPELRKSAITVPGRSGSYYQNDGAYNARTESVTCWYTRKPGLTIPEQSRQIAAWLSEEGTLIFDNEPDKYYIATFSGAPSLSQHQSYGEFSLTFTYSPPFAFSEQRSLETVITQQNTDVVIPVSGTAQTPCRIVIYNGGTSTIENITIEHSMI